MRNREQYGSEEFSAELIAQRGRRTPAIAESPIDTATTDIPTDPLRAYLNSLPPIMPWHEQLQLFQERDILRNQLHLSTEKERDKIDQRLLEIRNAVIEGNLRLALLIAKRHQRRGLDLLELIQEANIGIILAYEAFDVTKGKRFSTYTYWKMRGEVTHAAADTGRLIRLPLDSLQHAQEIKRMLKENPLVTDNQLADRLGITVELVFDIRQYISQKEHPASLDIRVGDEKEHALGDLFPDALDQFASSENTMLVVGLLNHLPQNLRDIVMLRFGLVDGKEWSRPAIAKLFGVTDERIRQREIEAIAKMRSSL